MKLPKPYLPKTYKGRVNWYVSPYLQGEPIHLFATKAKAIQWAKIQPPQICGGVVMTPDFDWFPAKSNPRETISSKRQFIDHR